MTASKRQLLGIVWVAALLGFACSPSQPEGEGPRAAALYQTCATCHGDKGQGDPLAEAPAIGGLGEWYVAAQLEKFKQGVRGGHPDDVAGLRMRPMARTLSKQDDLELVARYVAGLPKVSAPATLRGGIAARGKGLYTTCAACHGAAGEGNQGVNGPSLKQQSDWYMLSQLQKLKAGVRGADPRDRTGQQMAPMAQTLKDDQAMRDVVAYIKTL